MTPLEIRPLPNAGAEAFGVDVTELTVGDWNQIHAAFAAHGLLVFRDQILSADEHVLFARRWGKIEVGSDISPTSEPIGEQGPGQWRALGSYLPHPPLGTVDVARALQPRPSMRFANAYAAFDGLATTTQQALEALRVEHRHLNNTTTHPIVIHHPVSGRKALYVNPTYTTSVVGMDDEPGLALLNELYEHLLSPAYVETVDWEPGTVIVCDSRAVLSFEQHSNRVEPVSRVVIEGCELRPVVTSEPRDPSLAERAGATLAGGILTAAMAGIAEVIDPERTTHDIEIVGEAPEPQKLIDLEFGELDPLD